MKQFIKRISSIPPQAVIILVLIGVIGTAGAILLFKRAEPKAEAKVMPRAARLERLDGNVDIAQALNQQDNDQLNWADAAVNAPVTIGDRIFARDNSHAEIAFTGRNYARLNPNTALDVLSLADTRTQLALRNGSAIFDVGELNSGELFEIATPCGAVDFNQPGLYQLGIGDDGNPVVSVLNGLAQVVGPYGSSEISKGEVMTLACQTDAPALTSQLAPDTAGNIVDEYYSYRYPHRYDGRYRSYQAYLDAPDYYDPYEHSASYEYLDEDIPGLYDLDEYGDWQDVNGYGHCWVPRVEAGWSPYRLGYWDIDDVWGPTWVSSEPWGYAPYHYGRWAFVNQQRWVWVPEDCRTNAIYAPALVAFVPIQQSQIAWVPLAPGELYVPRYYDASFAPSYLESPQIVEQYVSVRQNYVNLNYTTAVTAVPVQSFTRRIDPTVVVPVNPQWIQQSQPVVDPFAVDGVRQVALQEERAQRKQARREMQAAIFNRPVVTSVAPVMPPVQANAAQMLQVQPVPEKQKRNKLRVENSGQVVAAQRADGVPIAGQQAPQMAMAQQRDQRIAELRNRLQQGDKSAKQELRQLKRERREQPTVAQPPQAIAPNQPVAPQQQPLTQKAQRRLERQQQMAQQQQAMQQAAQQQAQQKQQRRLERQQQAAQQQAQVNQQREQRRAQKQAERQQQAQQAMQQQAERHARKQAERQQRQQQMKPPQMELRRQQQAQQEAARQQMRMQRQQQALQQQRQAMQQSQMKAQRRAERQQQAMQQQQRQQAAAQWQMKAQRQAERQQRQQQMVQQQRQQMVQQQQAQRSIQQQQRQQVMQQQMRQQQQAQQQMRQQQRMQQPQMRQQQPPSKAPAMIGPPAPQGGKAAKRKP